ncbi:hypothetical protein Tfer_1707 [Thermincola ferriacetica]|uniref:DUF2062 domain-containing protein n=1 Tax=Thermincola ferriacetica TaxID=281456 RepID=A0A0L6W2J1_9FIRM|nr:DUF2062 domain-containing protein [Thermincola ferriacetica]KNZ69686.1 hypothetical protein Tfer_1707 [Thermincola ferriacetica]
MLKFRDIKEKIIKNLPRRHHLRGTILHRAIGEKLFKKECWTMTRHSVAAGLAVGTIVAFTPTIGLQMLLAGAAAYFLRVNIPAAIIVCWVTNPVTAPAIIPLQYKLGVRLMTVLHIGWVNVQPGLFYKLVYYAWPLWIGSLVSGLTLAIIVYWAVFLSWDRLMYLKSKVDRSLHNIHEEIEHKIHHRDRKQQRNK